MSLSDADSAETTFRKGRMAAPENDDARLGRGWRMLVPLALVAVAASACWGLDRLSLAGTAPTPAPAVVRGTPMPPPPIAAAVAAPTPAAPAPTPASDAAPTPSADIAEAATVPPAPPRIDVARRHWREHGRRHAVLAVDAGAGSAQADAIAPPTVAPTPAAPTPAPSAAAASTP